MKNYLGFSEAELNKRGAIHTAAEISGQPDLWENVYQSFCDSANEIKNFLNPIFSNSNLNIILSGAGTSAYIGESLEFMFQSRLNIPTHAISSTSIVTEPELYARENSTTLLISFSRSGNSPESVSAVNMLEEVSDDFYHFIISCNENGSLVKDAVGKNNNFFFLLPPEANDKSLAMTGSFSSMLLTGILITRLDELFLLKKEIEIICEAGKQFFINYTDKLKSISSLKFNRAVFLGSNILEGVARESHLKLQELTDGNVMCIYDSFLGLRHGPQAVIDENTIVIYLFSNNTYKLNYERDLVSTINESNRGLYGIGVTARHLNESKLDLEILWADGDFEIDEDLLSIISILPAQMLGFFKSLDLGHMPDTPCQSGAISRVVKGVKIYPFTKKKLTLDLV